MVYGDLPEGVSDVLKVWKVKMKKEEWSEQSATALDDIYLSWIGDQASTWH